MFAGHHRLARLTVLLDANNPQVDGPVDSITTVEPISAKWRAFGWEATDLDGHDVTALAAALAAAADAGRPQVLVCRTSTRHGLACLPPDAVGHFIKLPPELAAAAAAELTVEMGPAGRPARPAPPWPRTRLRRSNRLTAPLSSPTAAPWSSWRGGAP